MKPSTRRLIAAVLIGPGLAGAHVGLAHAQTVYIAGTHNEGQTATVSRGEGTAMTGDPNAYLVQYPRSLAPLVWNIPIQDTRTLDQSVRTGVHNTPQLATGDTVVCVSQGCIVSERVQENTTASGVSFVNYGDPTNSDGGLLTKLPPMFALAGATPVHQQPTTNTRTDYTYEYDLVGDAPDQPNPLSWVNAAMGMAYEHGTYTDANTKKWLASGQTVATHNADGGTHVVMLEPDLPLTRPLRQAGVPKATVDQLDRVLRPVVDAGYSGHNHPAPQASTTSTPKPVAKPHKAIGGTGRHRAAD